MIDTDNQTAKAWAELKAEAEKWAAAKAASSSTNFAAPYAPCPTCGTCPTCGRVMWPAYGHYWYYITTTNPVTTVTDAPAFYNPVSTSIGCNP